MELNWFQLPNTDHPVIPQNLYRLSGGPNNNERFEQIGQSWLKHAFLALEDNACGFGCNTNGCSQGVQLCSGCSDPYSAGLNADQFGIGSRAWVNPFTGSFPSSANNHNGHSHDGVSHRVRVEVNDLNTTLNLSSMSVEDILRAGGRSLFTPITAAQRVGNVGRNTLRSDGINNIDFGILKNTRIGENQRLQLRADFFNFTNSRDFGIPDSRVTSNNFLNQWGTDGGNRRIVVGLRYVF